MQEKHDNHRVRIHIDEKPYESPNPTTGEALYVLGHVQPGLELYREVQGDHEDRVILNDDEKVHLNQDEHFHSGPPETLEIKIIVNGRPKIVTARKLTFDQVVALAFNPVPANSRFTVTYSRGPRGHEKGSLLQGHAVRVKEGMIFNVTETGES